MQRNTMADSGRSNMNRNPQPGICPLEGDEVTFTHIAVEGPEQEETPPIKIRFHRNYGQLVCEAYAEGTAVSTPIVPSCDDSFYEAMAQGMLSSGSYTIAHSAWSGTMLHSIN